MKGVGTLLTASSVETENNTATGFTHGKLDSEGPNEYTPSQKHLPQCLILHYFDLVKILSAWFLNIYFKMLLNKVYRK